MRSINDFYKKAKRQYINLTLINAASLKDYLTHLFSFCMYYFLLKGKSPFPLNITLDLTYNCNLKCKFCFLNFLGRSNFMQDKPYLTYEEIERLIISLKGRATTFLLTGGEPTLRKDFIDIARLIKRNRFKCGVFSNATNLTRAISDNLIECDIDYLFFSLDGPKDIHDTLRGLGAFEKTYNNIDYISKKRRSSAPKIIMNALVLVENYKRLTEVVDIASELKIDGVAFDFLTFLSSKELDNHKKSFRESFPKREFRSLIYVQDFLDKDLKKLPEIIRAVSGYARKKKVRIFFKPDLEYEETKRWFEGDFRFRRRCIYPWNVLRISPYGDVYPCAQFFIKMGNIREAPLEKIWNNKEFCNFRRLLKSKGMLAGCNRCVKL